MASERLSYRKDTYIDGKLIQRLAHHGGEPSQGAVVQENNFASVVKTTLTLTDLAVPMTDAAANGNHGGVKIYDFPAGCFMLLGAILDIDVVTDGGGGIDDDAVVIASLGTVVAANTNETLTSTEADVLASTTVDGGALADGAGTFKNHGGGSLTLFDGHTTAKDLYLNFVAAAADAADDDELTVNGTITLVWAPIGDY